MNKIVVAFAIVACLSCTKSYSQSMGSTYSSALGIKAWGDGGGISYKGFIGGNQAFEGIGYFWNRGSRVVLLYEFHNNFNNAPGLKWYVGPGVHVGFYNTNFVDNRYPDGDGSGSFVGVDGVLGLDYKFDGAPINLSIDWQPSFEFGAYRGFIGHWGGLGVRYTF